MRKNLSADNSLFNVGLNIRQARRKRELTLSDIAQHTGIYRIHPGTPSLQPPNSW